MKKIHYKKELRNWRNAVNLHSKSVGFVPTMGALHQGHLSLINHSVKTCNLTISSIFVNPKQFDKQEDLVKYPRTEEQDCNLLELAGCNVAYLPSTEDLYDADYINVSLDLGNLAHVYEGEKRKGHFEGVVQVLYQLFSAVQPTDVFFGQKDYQQCMVVKKLLDKHFKHITLHTVPTHRDDEGLALSSRNARLSETAIDQARHFNKGLILAAQEIRKGKAEALKKAISYISKHGMEVEYLDFADASDLTPCQYWQVSPQKIVVIAAVWLEGIRLIDNLVFEA